VLRASLQAHIANDHHLGRGRVEPFQSSDWLPSGRRAADENHLAIGQNGCCVVTTRMGQLGGDARQRTKLFIEQR
jgi:hypothetical protein